MDIIIVVCLMLAGIFFFLLEIFFFPGISIAGVAGGVFVAGSVCYAFIKISPMAGFIALLIGLIILGFSIWYFFRSKTIDRISLHSEIDSKIEPLQNITIQKGDKGIAISRLAPIGTIEINGNRVEAKTISDFIDQGSTVEVTAVEFNTIIVRSI